MIEADEVDDRSGFEPRRVRRAEDKGLGLIEDVQHGRILARKGGCDRQAIGGGKGRTQVVGAGVIGR